MDKKKLRSKLSTKLQQQNLNEKKVLDQQIHQKLIQVSEFQKANRIAVYWPLKSEILIPYFESNTGKNFYFPKVNHQTNSLDFFLVRNFSELEIGYFGIHEPNTTQSIKNEEIDLIIVPGLGFDLNGNRLGRGLGFYDKVLQKLSCLKLALAYEFQILDKIPTEAHDQKIDLILTEKKLIHINKN